LVPGVTIRNPNANPGVTGGGSQPEPEPQGAAVGFADAEFVYYYPMDSIDLSAEVTAVDNFLAGLPGSKHYEDKQMRALAVQLRRVWASHFRKVYKDLAKYVNKLDKFEFEDDDVKLTYGQDGMEFADAAKVAAAAAAVAFVTKKQAEKAARKIVNEFKLSGKTFNELAEKSAVIMRKMLKRATFLDAKQAGVKLDQTPDEQFDAFLEEQTGRLIKLSHKTLADEVREFLITEIRDGSTPSQIADAMVVQFENFPTTKADRIARSETRDAANAATLITGEATGIKYVKAHDALKGPTDKDCEERDGKLLTIKEAWRELRKEHPYGTLGFELIPRMEFSIQFVNELPPDAPEDHFAYFDDATSTTYVLNDLDDNEVHIYLSALADWLIANPYTDPVRA
jgi:hypothetical protein